MRVVDANVLLYSVNSDAEHHEASLSWVDGALGGDDTVGLAWIVLLAFARLSTKVGLFPDPLSVHDAVTQIEDWISAPGAALISPGSGHVRRLEQLLDQVGAGGDLVNDAHLAAIALEHRADIVTYDSDFARFDGIRWIRPDDLLGG